MSSSGDPAEPGAMPPGDGNMKTRLPLVLVTGLFVFAAAAGALYLALQPTTLRIAVGPAGSDDHRLIQALAQALARGSSPVRLSLTTTAGPVDSAKLLGSAKADLAVARADNSDLPANAQSVAIMRKNVVVLWSPSGRPPKGARREPGPKIKALENLAGRRVGVVGRTEENVKLLRIILKESGIDPEKVAITQFGTDQVSEMTRDAKINAFMTVAPIDSKMTADAIASTARFRGEPRFLPIDVSEVIAQRHPLYESAEIAASSFGTSPARPDDKVETVEVAHLIVARKSLSETAVGAFTRDLFAVRQQIARDVPGAMKIEKPNTDKDAAIPAHPGAAAYIDGTERTFLEKYSDYMWVSILLLTGLGSAGAWLRYYLRREERQQNTLHRDRLMLTIAKVRQANSLEELAEMQGEVDGILSETLACYDDGAIEEGNLAAFGLVLQQFQHAVDDRRTVLTEPATELPRLRAR
jgi:TRAP transporter TAXI family solute receptor